jgi:uncharacterized protein
MNLLQSCVTRFLHSSVLRRTAIILLALTWAGIAFCGEIHEAAQKGDVAKVQALLKAHPELIFSRDSDGKTALHVAAYAGQKDVAVLLLANKSEVDARNNEGDTPLILAAALGHKDIVELLLANQADINAKGKDAWTPWRWAKKNGHLELADYLRQHGAKECSSCAEPERSAGGP